MMRWLRALLRARGLDPTGLTLMDAWDLLEVTGGPDLSFASWLGEEKPEKTRFKFRAEAPWRAF